MRRCMMAAVRVPIAPTIAGVVRRCAGDHRGGRCCSRDDTHRSITVEIVCRCDIVPLIEEDRFLL